MQERQTTFTTNVPHFQLFPPFIKLPPRPVLEEEYKSYVGMHPIPIRHGMTVGELSTMINEEGWLSDDLKLGNLKVIKMKKIPKSTQFYDWIAPSPNIPDKKTAFIYNGTCLFEGTNISEGRGTDHPFKIIGAPWVDSKDLMEYVQFLKKTKYGNKLITKEIHFTPKKSNAAINPKYENLVCNGIFIEYLDISIEPIDLVIDLLIYFNLNYTEFFFKETFKIPLTTTKIFSFL